MMCDKCGKPCDLVLCDKCTCKEILEYLQDLRDAYAKRDIKIPGETMSVRYARWTSALKKLIHEA